MQSFKCIACDHMVHFLELRGFLQGLSGDRGQWLHFRMPFPSLEDGVTLLFTPPCSVLRSSLPARVGGGGGGNLRELLKRNPGFPLYTLKKMLSEQKGLKRAKRLPDWGMVCGWYSLHGERRPVVPVHPDALKSNLCSCCF